MSQIKQSDGTWIDVKWFLASKTIWLNFIALLIPVLDIILKTNFIKDRDVYALLLAVFNILLRFKTKEQIVLNRN